MKVFKLCLIFFLIFTLALGSAYAAKGGQGKGKAAGHDKQALKSNPSVMKANKEISSQLTRGSSMINAQGTGYNPHNIDRGAFKASEKDELIQGLDTVMSKIEHAKWSHNPYDTRGQGNMGRPDMQDPYGFDKDSGREKSERARPIGEITALPSEEPPAEEPPAEEPPAEEPPVEEPPVEEPPAEEPPAGELPPEELPLEVISLMDPYVDYLLGLIEDAEANGSMYNSETTYADYLRGFLDNYIQQHMPTYIEQWTFTIPEGVDASNIIGVDFTELIDFSSLDDPNIQNMLQGIEEAKIKYDYTPTYVDYLEQFMNNYFISTYPELAQQIVDGNQ